MKKINWKVLIVTCIICLLPMAIGAIYFSELPNQIAVHFDINNEPNRYASKEFALFGIPIILTLLQAFCCIVSDINNKVKIAKPKAITILKGFIPILSIVIYTIMIQIALNNQMDVRRYVIALIGILFILIGNYLPKMSFENAQQFIHPAPKNEKVYRKMIRMISYTFVVLGILLLISLFFSPIVSAAIIIILVILILIEAIYCILNRKTKNS